MVPCRPSAVITALRNAPQAWATAPVARLAVPVTHCDVLDRCVERTALCAATSGSRGACRQPTASMGARSRKRLVAGMALDAGPLIGYPSATPAAPTSHFTWRRRPFGQRCLAVKPPGGVHQG